MKKFILKVLQNLLAMFLAFMLFSGILFFGLVLIGLLFAEKPAIVKEKSALVLDLSFNLSDSPRQASPLQAIQQGLEGTGTPQLHLKAVVDAIDRAAEDTRITGLFITGSFLSENYGSNFASLREMRDAILRFRKSGKPVTAYMVDPSLRDYYVASTADNLVLNPFGLVMLKGLAANLMFLGDAFEKYGIGVQTTIVGEYKSALEIFTRNKMSSENREQTRAELESLWTTILEGISENRGIDMAELRKMSADPAVFNAQQALEYGLVDELAYLDEVLDGLADITAYDENKESFSQVAFADYVNDAKFSANTFQLDDKPKVAVIYAEGVIVTGEGGLDNVGSDSFARELRKLRKDDDVKAVVLRVNSPGGSAVAAEIIEREIRLIGEEKPVVVSMGGVAASGGYWISSHAETIFAEKSTITGSIGVFGFYPNLEELANEHGVTFDGVKTSPYADIFTISRPKTSEEIKILGAFAEQIYDEFLKRVGEGRDMERDEVHKVARGRVWTGEQAIEIGLVDKIGGLAAAIDEAAALAELGGDYDVVQFPEEEDMAQIFEKLLSGSGGKPVSRQDPVSKAFTRLQREFPLAQTFNDPQGVYARLPYSINIQ